MYGSLPFTGGAGALALTAFGLGAMLVTAGLRLLKKI